MTDFQDSALENDIKPQLHRSVFSLPGQKRPVPSFTFSCRGMLMMVLPIFTFISLTKMLMFDTLASLDVPRTEDVAVMSPVLGASKVHAMLTWNADVRSCVSAGREARCWNVVCFSEFSDVDVTGVAYKGGCPNRCTTLLLTCSNLLRLLLLGLWRRRTRNHLVFWEFGTQSMANGDSLNLLILDTWYTSMLDWTHGRIPKEMMEFFKVVAKLSFCSVENPIGWERLMCKGRGVPRSLLKELSMRVSLYNFCSVEIIEDNNSCSTVDGYPQINQHR